MQKSRVVRYQAGHISITAVLWGLAAQGVDNFFFLQKFSPTSHLLHLSLDATFVLVGAAGLTTGAMPSSIPLWIQWKLPRRQQH